MLLSVAMIVKDEEQYIGKCLSALKEIQNKIKCEIIVVDTGSTDKTIEICKKYTHNVYYKEWNGSFADMRNVSLSYCTGEWVLIIDADEILEDSDEIIKLFESGKYKNFNSVSIRKHNITNLKTEEFIIENSIRLYRRTDELKYAGRIHEQLPHMIPVGVSNICVKHYGYQGDDIKKMIYKFERNKELLLIDYKEDSENPYTLFQLYQSYSMAKYPIEAHRYIDEAYRITISRNECNERPYIKQAYISSLFNMRKYSECLIELLSLNLDLNSNRAVDIDYYYMCVASAIMKEKYEVVVKYSKAYLTMYKKIKNNDCIWDLSCPIFTINEIDKIKVFLLQAYFRLTKYNKVIEVFNELKSDKTKETIDNIAFMSLIRLGKYKEARELLVGMELTNIVKEEICNEMKKISCCDTCNLYHLLGVDSEIDAYIKLCILNKHDYVDLNYVYFNKGYYIYRAEILKKLIINNQITIHNLVKLKIYDIQYIRYLMDDFIVNDYFVKYINEESLSVDFVSLQLNKNIMNELILKNIGFNDKIIIFKSIIVNKIYIDSVYNPIIFKDELYKSIMSRCECFWFKLCDKIEKKYSKVEYIRALNMLLKEYPEFNRVIELLIKDINNIVVDNKMILEKNNLLKITEGMINNGQIIQARDILNELLVSFDREKEIAIQLGLINYMEGKCNEALNKFAEALVYGFDNYEAYFNIAVVLELKGREGDAKYYYREAFKRCNDIETKKIIESKLFT